MREPVLRRRRQDQRVSVVMPAFNEEEGIGRVVSEFLEHPAVKEVVVADNNSTDRTAEVATSAGARVVKESRQGFGYACRRALSEGQGPYLVLVEPDRTFLPRDLDKFLAYAEDFDLVIGTRTTNSMIWEGANMGHFLKWGNWCVAKLLQLLFGGPSLSDVGCTYRFIHRSLFEKIEPLMRVGASHFLPELTILCLRARARVIEISVNYLKRRGTSKITGSFHGTVVTGLRMIALILRKRFQGRGNAT